MAATLRKVLLLPPGLWLRDYLVVVGFLRDRNFCRDITPPCTSVRNRPVRPGLVRTGTDGKNPSVRELDGDGAVFLRLDGDGRKGRPSTEKS